MSLIGEGYTNKVIASKLKVSNQVTKNYITRIYEKFLEKLNLDNHNLRVVIAQYMR
jgi:DNA-binding NarL/FixJ family response regulator